MTRPKSTPPVRFENGVTVTFIVCVPPWITVLGSVKLLSWNVVPVEKVYDVKFETAHVAPVSFTVEFGQPCRTVMLTVKLLMTMFTPMAKKETLFKIAALGMENDCAMVWEFIDMFTQEALLFHGTKIVGGVRERKAIFIMLTFSAGATVGNLDVSSGAMTGMVVLPLAVKDSWKSFVVALIVLLAMRLAPLLAIVLLGRKGLLAEALGMPFSTVRGAWDGDEPSIVP